MAKKPHGTMDYRCDSFNKTVVTRWNGNSVVTLASNCQAVDPVGKAKRYSSKERKITGVDESYVIRYYNQNMGGVDCMEQNISFHRIPVRGKKWWMPLFMFMSDTTMQNTWLLCRKPESSKSRPLSVGFQKRSC